MQNLFVDCFCAPHAAQQPRRTTPPSPLPHLLDAGLPCSLYRGLVHEPARMHARGGAEGAEVGEALRGKVVGAELELAVAGAAIYGYSGRSQHARDGRRCRGSTAAAASFATRGRVSRSRGYFLVTRMQHILRPCEHVRIRQGIAIHIQYVCHGVLKRLEFPLVRRAVFVSYQCGQATRWSGGEAHLGMLIFRPWLHLSCTLPRPCCITAKVKLYGHTVWDMSLKAPYRIGGFHCRPPKQLVTCSPLRAICMPFNHSNVQSIQCSKGPALDVLRICKALLSGWMWGLYPWGSSVF